MFTSVILRPDQDGGSAGTAAVVESRKPRNLKNLKNLRNLRNLRNPSEDRKVGSEVRKARGSGSAGQGRG